MGNQEYLSIESWYPSYKDNEDKYHISGYVYLNNDSDDYVFEYLTSANILVDEYDIEGFRPGFVFIDSENNRYLIGIRKSMFN